MFPAPAAPGKKINPLSLSGLLISLAPAASAQPRVLLVHIGRGVVAVIAVLGQLHVPRLLCVALPLLSVPVHALRPNHN